MYNNQLMGLLQKYIINSNVVKMIYLQDYTENQEDRLLIKNYWESITD